MGPNLAGIAPEVALSATILVLIVVDMLLRDHPLRHRVMLGGAVIGLAVAALSFTLLPSARGPLFYGMISLDGYALFFKGLFLAAALLAMLFGAISDEIPRARYSEYVLLILSVTLGMSLLAAARNLLMIYLALEMVSLPSYILTGFRRGDRAASEAALKYVIYGAASSGLMLYGFSLLYGFSGTLELPGVGRSIAGAISGGAIPMLAVAMAVLFSLVGFGYKIAAVPFHMWCPDVYQGAPTPFVAFLSVGPKAAGFAALMRFLLVGFGLPQGVLPGPTFPWPAVIGVLSVATMTLGNLTAIHQDNVKRLLAYSSIAHAGYMLMAVAVGSPSAIHAVMLYLPIYLFMNMGAFLAVMAVRATTGDERLAAFRGLGQRSPLLAVILAIFLFSLTGIPPLAGFIGKFYLFASLLRTGDAFFYVIALIGVLNSVVSLYYYVRIVRAMFLERPAEGAPVAPLTSPSAALLTLCAIPTVLLGIWWGPLASLIDRAEMLLR